MKLEINRAFLIKKIKQIAISYTRDPDFELSESQIEDLLSALFEKQKENPEEDLHYLLHDVIYDYLT